MLKSSPPSASIQSLEAFSSRSSSAGGGGAARGGAVRAGPERSPAPRIAQPAAGRRPPALRGRARCCGCMRCRPAWAWQWVACVPPVGRSAPYTGAGPAPARRRPAQRAAAVAPPLAPPPRPRPPRRAAAPSLMRSGLKPVFFALHLRRPGFLAAGTTRAPRLTGLGAHPGARIMAACGPDAARVAGRLCGRPGRRAARGCGASDAAVPPPVRHRRAQTGSRPVAPTPTPTPTPRPPPSPSPAATTHASVLQRTDGWIDK
jgi:hypothetical protein